MSIATGTISPLSVVTTPRGLGFMSPEGFRIIDYQSNISDPIGIDGQGVVAPFIYTVEPSRISAGCNGNIIRVSTQTTTTAGITTFEYWYDLGRQIWHGPHTFASTVIQPWKDTFILASPDVRGVLWQSDPVQKVGDTFVENSTQLTWKYQAVFLPDTDQMSNVALVQSLLTIQMTVGAPAVSVIASDQNNKVLDGVSLFLTGTTSVWNHFLWGHAKWGAPATALAARILPWHFPLVFVRVQMSATGQSDSGVRLGVWHFRYKPLRYLENIEAAA
jgi:hypothetical protein